MIGLRSTYSNWILKRIQNGDFNNTRANFADGMVKFSQQLSPKSRIQAFGYYSFDDINFAGIAQILTIITWVGLYPGTISLMRN